MGELGRAAASDFTGLISAELQRKGFAFARRFRVGVPAEEIALSNGRPLRIAGVRASHPLIPRATAPKNSYSGLYGLSEFPLHTDMAHWRDPPRYLMLRCIRGYQDVRTTLVDGHELVGLVGENTLVRALVRPRRPVSGVFPLMAIFRPRRKFLAALLRWDETFIVPASAAGIIGIECVRNALSLTPLLSVSLSEPGDTLWIDNWRMLHGRSAVKRSGADRQIDRVYLESVF